MRGVRGWVMRVRVAIGVQPRFLSMALSAQPPVAEVCRSWTPGTADFIRFFFPNGEGNAASSC